MPDFVSPDLSLKGSVIRLETLRPDHLSGLETASKSKKIWKHYARDVSVKETFRKAFDQADRLMKAGTEHCFVIINQDDQRIIGSTRFMDIQPAHRKLEIGWTWLHPDYWEQR